MAITYQIDPSTRLVHTRVNGHVSLEDALSHLHLLKHDPRLEPDFSNLIDLTHFTGTDLNPDALKAFAYGLQGEALAHNARRAIVAPADATFELSRRFQSLRPDPENFQVFHSMDEALHWLDIAPNRVVLFE